MADTTVAQAGGGQGYMPLRNMDGDHAALLRQAMEDADLLLAHATQSSLYAADTTTDALLRALANLRLMQQGQDPCPPPAAPGAVAPAAPASPPSRDCQVAEAELVFWKAYDQFARLLAPVSAHSLRSTRDYHEQPWHQAAIAATRVLPVLAIMTFFLALLLQGRSIDGRQLSERLKAFDQLRTQRHEQLRSAIDPLCALFTAPATTTTAKPTAAKPSAQTAVLDSSAGSQALRKLWSAHHAVMLLAVRQQGLLEEVVRWRHWQRQKEIVAALPWVLRLPLQWWSGDGQQSSDAAAAPFKVAASASSSLASQPAKPATQDEAANQAQLRSSPALSQSTRLPATDDEARKLCSQGPEVPATWGSELTRAEQLRLSFDSDMNLLETAYVPIVMGMLGATAFLLRGVVEHLRNFSYTPRFTSLYIVRLVLGMIAGVLGGALLPAGADSSIRAISPLMVPFLFGYAIEVFFSLLDKLVKSLTPSTTPPAPAAGAKPGQPS